MAGKENTMTEENGDNSELLLLEQKKQAKSRAKAVFTRTRHKLLQLIEDEETSIDRVKLERERMETASSKVMDAIFDLSSAFADRGDPVSVQQLTPEAEQVELELKDALNKAHGYLSNLRSENSSISSKRTKAKQLLQNVKLQVKTRQKELEEKKKKLEEEYKQQQATLDQETQAEQQKLQAAVRAAGGDGEDYGACGGDGEDYGAYGGDGDDGGDDCDGEADYTGSRGVYGEEVGNRANSWEQDSERTPHGDVGHLPGRLLPKKNLKTTKDIGKVKSVSPNDLRNDMWRQLKRVAIPVFTGDKTKYESWKAAFTACIDHAPATAEYKLLQLRQYLSGDALSAIENLGHSSYAYEAAKDRLERKFGGYRRQVSLQLEEIERLKPIKEENALDLEKFADLLDVAVINLKESGRYDELGNGAFYMRLQKKLPESMIARYQRWLYEGSLFEDVENLRLWINKEAEFQLVAWETVHGINSSRGRTGQHSKTRTYVGTTDSKDKGKNVCTCKVCSGTHDVWRCNVFKGQKVWQRWNSAKQLKLCFRCLGDDHQGQTCMRERVCGINGCKWTHNRLLHKSNPVSTSSVTKSNNDNQATSNNVNQHIAKEVKPLPEQKETTEGDQNQSLTMVTRKSSKKSEYVSLRTIPVLLKNGDRRLVVNALLDDASTKSFLNADVAGELGLNGNLEKFTVNVLNEQVSTFDTRPVNFEIESLDGSHCTNITAFTTKRVTGNMKVVEWSKHAHKWPHLKHINFPKICSRPIVDLLIGLDYQDLHFSLQDIRGNSGEPMARLTPLGWTCIGHTDQTNQFSSFVHTYFVNDRDKMEELNTTLQRFWEIEDVGTYPITMSEDESSAMNKVDTSLTFTGSRYQVGIPWKKEAPNLPNNYEVALRRLKNVETRLLKDPEIADSYKSTLAKYEEKGYVQKVKSEDAKQSKWYLPHFPVIKPERSTTKTRIVFDAAAKCKGVALNDFIHQGPKLQNDVFDVLLRFRRHPVGLVCDIAEMYLRIQLPQEDRVFHRFLWRNFDRNKPPEIYEFQRVVFGVSSSPFQAQFVARRHAELYEETFPQAADTILNSTYMDDSMDSVMDDAKGIELYKQLKDLWTKADMNARKWLSNSSAVLEHIPPEDRASEMEVGRNDLPKLKVLGVMWVASEDVFCFNYNVPQYEEALTKRILLKEVATIFDPLGFLSPMIIKAKIILQEVWAAGNDWDDPLNKVLQKKASLWFEDLRYLKEIKVKRCLQVKAEVSSLTLHTFVDASGDAYGSVVYARYVYGNGEISSYLVASKSRVAPLTSVSIPRLELMAAVLGLRLARMIAKIINISIDLIRFWSDSMNVLWWIRSRGRKYKPFIANRIGEIQSSTNPSQWQHVPGKENPADIVSRGKSSKELAHDKRWWHGPEFLLQGEEEWPCIPVKEPNHADLERRKSGEVDVTLYCGVQQSCLKPESYSNWIKLIRVQAWINRFINNCKISKKDRADGELTNEEIRDAEIVIIRTMQRESFNEEYSALVNGKNLPKNSKLLCLNPCLDEDKVMRVDGRLKYAEFLSYDNRYPIILPRKNWVTKLIVKHYHELGKHCHGTNHTLLQISARYWVVSGREEIRAWEKECNECKRLKAKVATQVMAPLPSVRLQMPLRAFSHAAVDFGGPFITMQGRRKPRVKRYLCLFTCLASRAVHLELAYGLDTDSFLNAFYRFVNRRGLPQKMVSDNGTNFVGAVKELRELTLKLDNCKIKRKTSSLNNGTIQWEFNPPMAPHFGGVHEVMIKAAKKAIYAILSNAEVTDEDLLTAFSGAENLLNSRPLTYQSASPKDDTPLTPNHFLIGQMGGKFAPESTDDLDFNPRKRWRRVQELVKHFWQRWMKEWIPGLHARRKWFNKQNNVEVGDVVLLVSPDTTRGHWPLGKVLEVFPGKDGCVRVVKLKVGSSELIRPISRICPLELDVQ